MVDADAVRLPNGDSECWLPGCRWAKSNKSRHTKHLAKYERNSWKSLKKSKRIQYSNTKNGAIVFWTFTIYLHGSPLGPTQGIFSWKIAPLHEVGIPGRAWWCLPHASLGYEGSEVDTNLNDVISVWDAWYTGASVRGWRQPFFWGCSGIVRKFDVKIVMVSTCIFWWWFFFPPWGSSALVVLVESFHESFMKKKTRRGVTKVDKKSLKLTAIFFKKN